MSHAPADPCDLLPKSLWPLTAPDRRPGEALAGKLTCDVAVVGAGFTGLRAALDLAEAGCNVAVFDRGEVGHGASGRSGGQVNPLLPVSDPMRLRRTLGDVYFERLTRASLGSADALFALVEKYAIACNPRQHGWLRADHSPAARKRARAAARAWNRFGADLQFLGTQDVVRLAGSKAYASATFSAKGGAVQPLALVRGLAEAAQTAGARIYTQSPVTQLARADRCWTMGVAGHRVRADTVILATNAYTDTLLPGLQQSILPLHPIQIATVPLSDGDIGCILRGGQTISDTRRLIMYARREPDRRVVFGGIGYRRRNGALAGFGWLCRDAARVFPRIRPASWHLKWGGCIAVTDDRLPHLHEPAPGLLAGLGYNGRGVAMALVMGQVLAARALGADPNGLTFPILPVRPKAFRRIQLLGTGTAMRIMRMRDQWEWARVS